MTNNDAPNGIRPIPDTALASASELLTEAFFDNPAHVCIFPDERSRSRHLRWLFERNLRLQTAIGQSFCRLDEDELRVIAMGVWHPPGTAAVGVGTMIRYGLALAPLRIGPGATGRMLRVVAAIEDQREEAQQATPAWYLNNMVIAKPLRGTGLGSELLAEQLRDAVDASGQAAILATQRPENVAFYRRLGFEVASEKIVGEGSLGFRSWIMIRAAGRDAGVG